MEDFIKKLPKLELHAHLNGSLSDSTLLKLVQLRQLTQPDYQSPAVVDMRAFRSLDECFAIFSLAHDLVDSMEAVKVAAENVIREFSEDNVVYLELRSTPRENQNMSKKDYMLAIIDTITSCKVVYPNIIVKYLPSINISYGFEEASKNFELFSELRKKHPDIILGMDLSGDPSKGKFKEYVSIFEQARGEGFRLAIHCGEVKNDDEILDMLEFMKPEDRIGHGTFIDESNERIWKLFTAKQIPVEICLTSNVLCKTAPSYEDHHITRLLKIKHPLMICTDDFGVFKTSLSTELRICAKTYNLSEADIIDVTVNANRFSFANDLERQLIGDMIETFRRKWFS